jgi:hypothetical protein
VSPANAHTLAQPRKFNKYIYNVKNEQIRYKNVFHAFWQNGTKLPADDTATKIMRNVYEMIGKPKDEKDLTGLAQKAEGVLSMALEWWPRLQRPFAKGSILPTSI